MAVNLFGRTRNAGETARVKGLLRSVLQLPEDSTVMGTELRCTEPGCPPLETVLAILVDGSPRQRKLHKPLAAVTEADVRAAWHGGAVQTHEIEAHLDCTEEKKPEYGT